MADELNPCPFCGSANLDHIYPSNAAACGVIACRNCGCEGPDAGPPDEYIAAWNARAPADRIAELEAALKPFAEIRGFSNGENDDDIIHVPVGLIRAARATLKGKTDV